MDARRGRFKPSAICRRRTWLEYADYDDAVAAVARHFSLAPAEFVLTNGLDEGLHSAATLALRGRADGEAIILEPAFDMYAIVTEAIGGRPVRLGPTPDLSPGIEQRPRRDHAAHAADLRQHADESDRARDRGRCDL